MKDCLKNNESKIHCALIIALSLILFGCNNSGSKSVNSNKYNERLSHAVGILGSKNYFDTDSAIKISNHFFDLNTDSEREIFIAKFENEAKKAESIPLKEEGKFLTTDNSQEEFIKQKSDLYYAGILNPINAAQTTMFKEKTTQMTNAFLKENKNTLTNWTGTVSSVSLCDENGVEYGGNDKQKKIVNLMIVTGEKKFDSGGEYSINIVQWQRKKVGVKGIYPDNQIYDKVINLREGQHIQFTAKVINAIDRGTYEKREHHGTYNFQETVFEVQFSAITPQ